MPIKTLIMGAAGRDFHNFNTFFRGNKDYEVVAFTATQIPDIEGRLYPTELAGDLYPSGIPIRAEEELIELIEQISRFPNAVQQAANEYRPLVMAAYAYELANAFHSFYHAVPVLQSEDESVRNARLRLVAAAKQTIANALRLLDIQAPDVM